MAGRSSVAPSLLRSNIGGDENFLEMVILCIGYLGSHLHRLATTRGRSLMAFILCFFLVDIPDKISNILAEEQSEPFLPPKTHSKPVAPQSSSWTVGLFFLNVRIYCNSNVS